MTFLEYCLVAVLGCTRSESATIVTHARLDRPCRSESYRHCFNVPLSESAAWIVMRGRAHSQWTSGQIPDALGWDLNTGSRQHIDLKQKDDWISASTFHQ